MILMRRIVRHHAGRRISLRGVWQGELRWREGSEDRSGWNRRVGRLVEAVFGRLQSNVHSLSSVPSIPPSPIRCRYSGTPSEAAKQRLNNGQDRHVIHQKSPTNQTPSTIDFHVRKGVPRRKATGRSVIQSFPHSTFRPTCIFFQGSQSIDHLVCLALHPSYA